MPDLAPYLEQLAQRVATARTGIADAGIGPGALSSVPHTNPAELVNALAAQRAAAAAPVVPYDGTGGRATANGLNGEFQRRLSAMFAAAPGQLGIKSGFRTNAEQQALWARHPDPRWVAHPGHSNHEKGIAADLSYSSPALVNWVHANARQFGLWFPLSNENWHVEPLGSRG